MIARKQLGELCEIVGGNPAPKGEDAFGQSGIPFLKMKDLGRYHTTNNLIEIENKVSKEVAKRNNLKLIKKGSILLPRSGSVGLNHRAILGIDSYMVSHVFALQVKNSSEVLNVYLYYYLLTIDFERITKKTTGLDAVNFSDVAKIEVPVPKISEQIQIAKILTQSESLITQRKEGITLMDDFLKSVYLETFGDPTKNEKKFQLGKIRDLVSEVKYGTSKPSEASGEFPYLRMNNITYDGYMDFSNLKYINLEPIEIDKYLVQKGDILFNRTNSKELVGKTGVFNSAIEMAIAGYLIRVRTNEKANPWFIWGYLNSLHGKQTLKGMCKSIVGMANINAQELQDIAILIPPLALQQKFSFIVEKCEAIKEGLQNSLLESQILFDVLSRLAFTGKLLPAQYEQDYSLQNAIGSKKKEPASSYDLVVKKKSMKKIDITNLSLGAYYGIPFEIQTNNEKWIFDFVGDDLFYQFLLKDIYPQSSFTFDELSSRLFDFFYRGDIDFDNKKWNEILFKFMSVSPPLIEQIFDERTKTIKLRLTDEAFKA